MKWVYLLNIALLLALLTPFRSIAQEEESAEISLEDNTDVFQELFFEALKQKGIENYDKAINALLECKEIDPQSHVIDHELAKTYHLNKQFVLAQESAIQAVNQEPENLWYLNTSIDIIGLQTSNFQNFVERIPYENQKLKENFATILVAKKQYELAKKVLRQIGKSSFTNDLMARIADSLDQQQSKPESNPLDSEQSKQDPLAGYMESLNDLLAKEAYEELGNSATEALEAYPLQPFFYYVKGVALNQAADFSQAADYLKMGLDFIYEDDDLTFKFYKELVFAYKGLGDAKKANMYLSKMKNGL